MSLQLPLFYAETHCWTNIDKETFQQLGAEKGDLLMVRIKNGEEVVFEGKMPYVNTFGDVPEGDMLAFLNSGPEARSKMFDRLDAFLRSKKKG